MKCKKCCVCYRCRFRKKNKISIRVSHLEEKESAYVFNNKTIVNVLDQVKQIESTYLVLGLMMLAGAFYGHLLYSDSNPVENFHYMRMTGTTILGFFAAMLFHSSINKLKNTLVIYSFFLLVFIGIPLSLGLRGFYTTQTEKLNKCDLIKLVSKEIEDDKEILDMSFDVPGSNTNTLDLSIYNRKMELTAFLTSLASIESGISIKAMEYKRPKEMGIDSEEDHFPRMGLFQVNKQDCPRVSELIKDEEIYHQKINTKCAIEIIKNSLVIKNKQKNLTYYWSSLGYLKDKYIKTYTDQMEWARENYDKCK